MILLTDPSIDTSLEEPFACVTQVEQLRINPNDSFITFFYLNYFLYFLDKTYQFDRIISNRFPKKIIKMDELT